MPRLVRVEGVRSWVLVYGAVLVVGFGEWCGVGTIVLAV